MNRSENEPKTPEWLWYMVLGPPAVIGVGALAGYNTGGVGAGGPDEITFAILAMECVAGWVLGILVYVLVRTARRWLRT